MMSVTEGSKDYDLSQFLDIIQISENDFISQNEPVGDIKAIFFTINHALVIKFNQAANEIQVLQQFLFEQDLIVDSMANQVIFIQNGKKQEYNLFSNFDAEVVQMHAKKA